MVWTHAGWEDYAQVDVALEHWSHMGFLRLASSSLLSPEDPKGTLMLPASAFQNCYDLPKLTPVVSGIEAAIIRIGFWGIF